MRSIGPAVTREQCPAFLRNSSGRLALPGPTQEGHKIGIKPDIEVEFDSAKYKESNGEEDNQLDAAINEMLKKMGKSSSSNSTVDTNANEPEKAE